MIDYAIPCPACKFVLRFHDASLLGRKARCPQCHLKFVREERTDRSMSSSGVTVRRSTESISSAGFVPVRRSADPEAGLTVTAEGPSPFAAPAASASASAEDRWSREGLSQGFRAAQAARRRWTLPDPLRLSHASVIALGACGGSTASLLWTSGPDTVMSALAAIVGGLITTGVLGWLLQ